MCPGDTLDVFTRDDGGGACKSWELKTNDAFVRKPLLLLILLATPPVLRRLIHRSLTVSEIGGQWLKAGTGTALCPSSPVSTRLR